METTKAKDVLKVILDYEDNKTPHFREWFLQQFEQTNASNTCCLEEFAEYFINSLRQSTERHLKVSNGTETSKSETPVRTLETKAATPREDSAATPRRLMLDLKQQITSTPNQSIRMNENSQQSTGFRNEISQHPVRNEISQISIGAADCGSCFMPPRTSTSADRSGHSQGHDSSTPIKRNVSSNSRKSSTTPTSSVCLGDFLILNKSNSRSHKKKNTSATVSNQNQSSQQHEKPKKRVQPTCVSKKIEKAGGNSSSVFVGESSFSNENNILKISHTEVEDKEQCTILAARKILRSKASEITKELTESPVKRAHVMTTSTPTKQQETEPTPAEESRLDLGNLEENKTLQRLADIYITLIDLSMATNFLNELSFLLNLLNASSVPSQNDLAEAFERLGLQNEEEDSKNLNCLTDLKHAVCFAILCLNQQKCLLASLDTKTLKVIINNGRFSYLKKDVREFLLDIYQRKQLILTESNIHDSSYCFADTKSCANVHFQQDQDSRQNFSSNQEFDNFRVQRDLFYKCLKVWETNHLNPNWKFSIEVGNIVREIFQQSELFVNMAHFANLFVSQLLLSASNASSPEEIGLDVDMQKLSRLTERLIAPSQFSVNYQFPRAQAFFRDFILKARSLAFAEQLKMVLYSELVSLNDSSFDHVNITKAENETYNHDNSFIANFTTDLVAVRPEILNSMLILAKFLGFTISLPYTYQHTSNSDIIPTAVEKKQISLRTLIQPNFDLHSVVQVGIEEGKLLITIPWMVQYISMLDSITLQLEVHTKVLNLLFALHWYLARDGANTLPTTSKFIITACLSWLFDSKPIITEQYYSFRLMQTTNPNEPGKDLVEIKSKFEKFIQEDESSTKEFALNPVLEALLPVACPFLGEFRVSIMPAKYASTKYASRSGRYRHITTRIAELPPTQTKGESTPSKSSQGQPKAAQQILIQGFFHTQNSSTRQLISFCSERSFKSVVRDAQLNILLPSKSKADAKVNKINSCNFEVVYKEINIIYRDAHKEAFDNWNDTVPTMLDKRVKAALDSLLPEETSAILKKTYFMVIKNNANHKISQWFYANMIKDNYFCVDLINVAKKICTADKTKLPSELKIVTNTPSSSELISSLQYWLHCTSVRTELFKDSRPIVDLLQRLNESFKNVLPTVLYRLLASYTIQLLQNVITNNCVHLTDELIEAACEILLKSNSGLNLTSHSRCKSVHCIYGGTITVAFLQTLVSKPECYAKFGQLVIAMIKKDIISLNYTNELFVSIFKYDWPSSQLNEISTMLRNISQATASVPSSTCGDDSEKEDDDEKSTLFMDMLADLSRDVELF